MSEKKAKADASDTCVGGRILRRRDVEIRTGLSESAFTDLEKKGEFPARRRVGARAVGWLEREIAEWINSRPAVRSLAAGGRNGKKG